MLRKLRRSTGVTLLELLVAITVTGMVTTLCFRVWGDVTRLFVRHDKAAGAVRSAMLIKKKVERSCGRFSLLLRCTEREVFGIDAATDSAVLLRYAGASLLDGTDTIVSGLETFTFSLMENRKNLDDRNAVLLWEGVIVKTGAWVGGAVAVKKP